MIDVSRLSRTARLALGAALVTACVGNPQSGPSAPPNPAAVEGSAPTEPLPSPTPSPAADAGPNAGGDPGTPAALYGVPANPEPSPPPQPKQGPNDPGTMKPLYGVPPGR